MIASDIGRYGIVPEWLIDSVSGKAIRLFAKLAAAYADREGVCWPSRSRLAQDLKASLKTVDRALQELQAAGALEVVARWDAEGDRTSNLYRLHFARPDLDEAGGSVKTDATVGTFVGGGVKTDATGSVKTDALTRPNRNQREEEDSRASDIKVMPTAEETYNSLLSSLPDVSSNIVAPARYWSAFEGSLVVEDFEALKRAVQLAHSLWGKRQSLRLRLPVQIQRLEEIGRWALDMDRRGKRISTARGLQALRNLGPPGLQAEATLVVLADVGLAFVSEYEEMVDL
jgi:hypothetical protein